jgi:hypothetical protein
MPDEVIDLILGRVVGQALQELREVLLSIEVMTSFRGVMKVPGLLLQFLEGSKEI